MELEKPNTLFNQDDSEYFYADKETVKVIITQQVVLAVVVKLALQCADIRKEGGMGENICSTL